MNPRWPVFVPTKGRWEDANRLTLQMFDALGVPYRAVVQPQDYDHYAPVVDPARILVLPADDIGLVATRNWIWDLARDEGHAWFWTFDDNISRMFRRNRNLKVPMADGTAMRCIEDFAARYENVVIAGMNYETFVHRRVLYPPVYLNGRVYSNMLLQTDYRDPRGQPYRNEGRFNDDTDLNLRVLKDGNCTLLFNAFLVEKRATETMKGGMDYRRSAVKEEDHRYIASTELAAKHPDVTKVTRKFSRWHHHVDYEGAMDLARARRGWDDDALYRGNRLVPRAGVVVPAGPDEYGMVLERLQPDGSWLEVDLPWYPWEVDRLPASDRRSQRPATEDRP